jgi:N-acyl amino acid synthase FeeM
LVAGGRVGRFLEVWLSLVQETRSGLLQREINLLDQVDYRLAVSEVEREAIYHLRYRAYLLEGAIEPRADQRLTDRFDDLPNSWLFGVYLNGELRSSLRVSVATPDNDQTPAVDAFRDLLEPELARGKVIVDPNRFVADPQSRTEYPELPYLTVRLGYLACGHFNADIGTATVRAEHRAFYRRLFLQEALCEPRPYPTLTKPLCLMAADYRAVRDRIFARFPVMRSTAVERQTLFNRNGALPPIDLPEFPFAQAPISPTA